MLTPCAAVLLALAHVETVEVYYVEAPLMSAYGSFYVREAMLALQAFHAGIAIRYSNGSAIAYEYDAAHGLFAGVLPDMSSGLPIWHNDGIVRLIDFNVSYWQRASLVATIPEGDPALAAFTTWTRNFNASAPDYNGFEVIDAANKRTLINSSTCADYAAVHATAKLRQLGMRVAPLVKMRRSRAIMYSIGSPRPVSADDASLIDYWRAINTLISDGMASVKWVHTLEVLAMVAEEVAHRRGVAFVRSGGIDYRIELAPPYARFSYDEEPHGALDSEVILAA